jgi:hypothetical protein
MALHQVIGDWVGRRWGLIQDAIIMFIGLLMLTASWGLTLEGWVICYAWSLFFYSMSAVPFFLSITDYANAVFPRLGRWW